MNNNVFAANQSSNVNYSVTVEDSLSISVSSSNVVLDLNPAVEEFKSKDLTVKVGTNNTYGYKLYINAGSTNLTKTDDTSSYIENITSEADQTNFPTNKWGYKVNSNLLMQEKYNPFTSGTMISYSKTATSEDLSTLTFAAKANMDKPAGSYKLDLEFEAVATVASKTLQEAIYMQDITPEIVAAATHKETATLEDKRDGQLYTVVKYGDLLWMTRNLAIGCNGSGSTYGSSVSQRTLTSDDSNVGSNRTTTTALLQNASFTADYTDPRMQCNSTYGAWYNYSAASVQSITGASNVAEAQYSVCPYGWRLPTYADGQALKTTDSAIISMISSTTGGFYNGRNGLLADSKTGYYWTSAQESATTRWYWYHQSGILGALGSDGYRPHGFFVRCVSPAS